MISHKTGGYYLHGNNTKRTIEMLRTYRTFPLAFALAVLLGGCSSSSTPSTVPPEIAGRDLQIDFFSARGFLGGSEYERYYLTDSVLWRECGQVSKSDKKKRKKLDGDKYLGRDPTLEIKERRAEKLSNQLNDELKIFANNVVSTLKRGDYEIPPPGAVFSLSDPGILEMKVTLGEKNAHIVTSVDAVASRDSLLLKQAHELYSYVRGVGPVICNSKTFYGISRRSLK